MNQHRVTEMPSMASAFPFPPLFHRSKSTVPGTGVSGTNGTKVIPAVWARETVASKVSWLSMIQATRHKGLSSIGFLD